MGLSELMRMSIIFVTFCLNLKKKKSHKDSEVKNIQINFHCKVKKKKKKWGINGCLQLAVSLPVIGMNKSDSILDLFLFPCLVMRALHLL